MIFRVLTFILLCATCRAEVVSIGQSTFEVPKSWTYFRSDPIDGPTSGGALTNLDGTIWIYYVVGTHPEEGIFSEMNPPTEGNFQGYTYLEGIDKKTFNSIVLFPQLNVYFTVRILKIGYLSPKESFSMGIPETGKAFQAKSKEALSTIFNSFRPGKT